jgi:ABC-2 type transport system permease protein
MRYARLYVHLLRFSFVRALEFRLDFFFRFGMDAVWYAYQLAFFEILFLQTPTLMGWSAADIRVFIGAVFVADALHMTVFASNMWWFPILVNRGDLDYYLVRPVSSLYFLSVREFAANSFLNLVLAVGVLVVMVSAHPVGFGVGRLLLFGTLMGIAALLHYALNLMFLLPVIWMHNASGLRELWFGLGAYTSRPDAIFRGWIRRLLTTILPVAVIVSFPVRALLAEAPWPIAGHVVAATAGALVVLGLFWRLALRSYSSASS